jgi:hypothetical protein
MTDIDWDKLYELKKNLRTYMYTQDKIADLLEDWLYENDTRKAGDTYDGKFK